MQEIPVGSVLVGREEGVCIIESLALRRKSPLPPRPASERYEYRENISRDALSQGRTVEDT